MFGCWQINRSGFLIFSRSKLSTDLPVLPNCDHAHIQSISIGPRHEVTLTIQLLCWSGNHGVYSSPIRLRFGGMGNFEQAETFFSLSHHQYSELAYIRYDKQQQSKYNQLFLRLEYERVEAHFTFQCRNVSITPTKPPELD